MGRQRVENLNRDRYQKDRRGDREWRSYSDFLKERGREKKRKSRVTDL